MSKFNNKIDIEQTCFEDKQETCEDDKLSEKYSDSFIEDSNEIVDRMYFDLPAISMAEQNKKAISALELIDAGKDKKEVLNLPSYLDEDEFMHMILLHTEVPSIKFFDCLLYMLLKARENRQDYNREDMVFDARFQYLTSIDDSTKELNSRLQCLSNSYVTQKDRTIIRRRFLLLLNIDADDNIFKI